VNAEPWRCNKDVKKEAAAVKEAADGATGVMSGPNRAELRVLKRKLDQLPHLAREHGRRNLQTGLHRFLALGWVSVVVDVPLVLVLAQKVAVGGVGMFDLGVVVLVSVGGGQVLYVTAGPTL